MYICIKHVRNISGQCADVQRSRVGLPDTERQVPGRLGDGLGSAFFFFCGGLAGGGGEGLGTEGLGFRVSGFGLGLRVEG